MKCNYRGADWLKMQLSYKGRTPSSFGEQLADLLGNLFKGIYHIDEYVLRKSVKWEDDQFIQMPLGRELSTWDSSDLTELVLRCHAEGIRLEITTCRYSVKYDGRSWKQTGLLLKFHRLGSSYLCGNHPMLRTAVEKMLGPFCSVCLGVSRTCTHCGGCGHEPPPPAAQGDPS